MAEYLFTYGTLRLDNSHQMAEFLAKNATLIGLALLPKAKLYRIEWYPALIKSDNIHDEVTGDLFMLNDINSFQKIDEYEGIGIGFEPYEYRREKVKVITDTDELESWVYFYNIDLPTNAEHIESGDFLNP